MSDLQPAIATWDTPSLGPSPCPQWANQTRASAEIRVLTPAVAARIAAGEVVERPASVVKELIENAVDADAQTVRIDIRAGGLELIRVADDGRGIPPDRLWLACQRHATSKLPHDDLDGIRTLGFRGEALPSIAAVSELTVVSAVDHSGIGRRLTLRDAVTTHDQPAPRPRGSTVSVRGLFSNLPARRAAAARVQTEVAQIAQTARRLALAAPDVRFALFTEDRMVFQTSGSGRLATVLVELYGPAIATTLTPMPPVDVAGARLTGIVAASDVTLPGRSGVNLLVNGRWVQPRGFMHSVEAAYRPVVPRGRHPILILSVETPPDRVDVNIHPAKLEVRLHAERLIATEAGRLIKEVLRRRPISLGFAPLTGLAALDTARPRAVAEDPIPYDVDSPIVTPGLPPLRLIGQMQDRLIMLEGDAGIYLVDQHRAHERILYERLAATHGRSGPDPVLLPEPILIELRPAQVARFTHRLPELAALGFGLDVFGGRAFLLRSSPVLPGVTWEPDAPLAGLGEPDELASTLLSLGHDDEDASDGESWRDRLLVRLSCRTAVRRGRPLDRPAMRALVEGLGHTPSPAVCPHGSPLLMHVSGALLAKEFDWT